MFCSRFCLCSPRVFVFGFVKAANKVAQLGIYQKYALFRCGVSQFKVGNSVMWLPLFRSGGTLWFPAFVLCANLWGIKASAMCHLSGVPSVVNLVAFRVYNKWFKPTPTLCRFVHSLRSLSHKAVPVLARFNQALYVGQYDRAT